MRALHLRPSLLIFCLLLITTWVPVGIRAEDHGHARIVFFGKQPPNVACRHKLEILQMELRHFPYPDDWTLGVACDPITWEQALRRADFPPTHTAFTGIKPRMTVLNGEIFNEQPGFYEHTLAHELGHIRCSCSDESAAEEIGTRYLRSPEYLSLVKGDGEANGASR